jgi:HKD family nuclease
MNVTLFQQKPSTPSNSTLLHFIENALRLGAYNRARVAMAYVTVSGLRSVLDSFPRGTLASSQWLVGLDDAITHPGAIDLLLETTGASLKVASNESRGLRFHPKILEFGNGASRLAIVGSANLTSSALSGNSEAAAIVQCDSPSQARELDVFWDGVWSQGREPTESLLQAYRQKYKAMAMARARAEKEKRKHPLPGRDVLDTDLVELDPALATTCWIECGFITAMGRELEFKAEQGLFFGLSPSGEAPRSFKFKTTAGTIIDLRMKYQRNHMWRLQMNNDIPEVRKGLRPTLADGTLGRSPFVAVFVRTSYPAVFTLRFMRLSSQEFARLKLRSGEVGAIGQTTARLYGWC